MSKETTPQLGNNEEVDLGLLFKLIGKSFDRFFNQFIGSRFPGITIIVEGFLLSCR